MILYNNCTFKELFDYEANDLNFYITTGLFIPSNDWGNKSLTSWSYGRVMELLLFFDNDIEMQNIVKIISFAANKKESIILNKPWHEVFAFFNWLQKEVDSINVMLKTLYVKPTPDEENAGVENFAQFGPFATIDRLAGGDPLKYDAIEAMPFMIIFTKLSLSKVESEYREAYQAIMIQKAKSR